MSNLIDNLEEIEICGICGHYFNWHSAKEGECDKCGCKGFNATRKIDLDSSKQMIDSAREELDRQKYCGFKGNERHNCNKHSCNMVVSMAAINEIFGDGK